MSRIVLIAAGAYQQRVPPRLILYKPIEGVASRLLAKIINAFHFSSRLAKAESMASQGRCAAVRFHQTYIAGIDRTIDRYIVTEICRINRLARFRFRCRLNRTR